jgi:YgiT-type zinc finger domain-containing protein
MLLKRIFTPSGELDYISLAHTGSSPEQNFSTQLVTGCLKDGIMEINGDALTFHVYPEGLRYTIKRTPGRYCVHCGEKLPDDTGGELARLHVAQEHAGVPSPDKNNPAGYEAIHYFECVLSSAQHKKYKKQGHPVVAHFPLKEEA